MSRVYEFTDRLVDAGYTGRWRYRVVERDVGSLYGRKIWSILFKRRIDASTFRVQCDVFGVPRAARALDATGLRRGEDFKLEGEPYPSRAELLGEAPPAVSDEGPGPNPKTPRVGEDGP